jgi:hypothetical protein
VSRAELGRLLDTIAAGLPPELAPAERAEDGGAVTWSRAGVAFAVLGDDGVELRLDDRIAAAAARTPDAAPSGRGTAWVRFNPRTIDPHAVDRLEAWFILGARRANERSRPSDDRA